jgi:hypothetical protein
VPRIDGGDTGRPGRGFWRAVPWKAILAVLVIAGAWAFVWQKFRELHPDPAKARVSRGDSMPPGGANPLRDIGRQIQVTPDQAQEIVTIAMETTNPLLFAKDAMAVLTPDQRDKVAKMLPQLMANSRQMQQQAQAKRQKLLPGNDLRVAIEGNRRIREETRRRKEAAARPPADR